MSGLERLDDLLGAHALGVDRVGDVAHHGLDLHPVGLGEHLDQLARASLSSSLRMPWRSEVFVSVAIPCWYRAGAPAKLGCAHENSREARPGFRPAPGRRRSGARRDHSDRQDRGPDPRLLRLGRLESRRSRSRPTKAKAYLIKRTHGKHAAKKPALVLDIDETSLDNYPCLDEADGIPYNAGRLRRLRRRLRRARVQAGPLAVQAAPRSWR